MVCGKIHYLLTEIYMKLKIFWFNWTEIINMFVGGMDPTWKSNHSSDALEDEYAVSVDL